MPVERSEKRRQTPAACHMCRTKKLKCDLQHPCSNCSSRHWTCEYTVRQDAVACAACRFKKIKCDRGDPCSSCQGRNWKCEYIVRRWSPPRGTNHNSIEAVQTMQSRISKLEEVVFGREHAQSDIYPAANAVPPTPWSDAAEEDDVVSSRRLEDICGGLADESPQLTRRLVLNVMSSHEIARNIGHLSAVKEFSLPPRDVAMRALHTYEECLESALHILHVPTLRVKIQALYEEIGDRDLGRFSGTIALLLAICAQIGFWVPLKQHGLLDSTNETMVSSKVLTHSALEALDHARDSSIITIETVQAAVLLVFLFFHMEGFSSRARILHSTALTMARELGLHRIDATKSGNDRQAVVDDEIGRKLWWYMVGTDWLLAFNSGPTEGVFTIIPQQMSVRKPRNLLADDLLIQDADFTRPRNAATNMAYYLFRLDLAEVCRRAVDCGLMQDHRSVPYEMVYDLDAAFVDLAANLSPFLRLSINPQTINSDYGDTRGIQISLQRALCNLMVAFRRCKLHMPFLVRYKEDPRYGFSRRACLESAQTLLEVRRAFLDDTDWYTSSIPQLLGIYRFMFYSAMVLVVDLCINKPAKPERLIQVRNALETIADLETSSRTAAKFLNALREVLSKHGIRLPGDCEDENRQTRTTAVGCQLTPGISNDGALDFSDFELLWPENLANDDVNWDSQCWDAFINLDMRL